MKKGFTLIELLVVVLIIGILSAVALPRYEKTVWKSRSIQLKTLVRSLATAQENYYLANNSYSNSFANLDIQFDNLSSSSTSNMGLIVPSTDAVRYNDWFELAINANDSFLFASAVFRKGPYKGQGFSFVLQDTSNTLSKGWYCQELSGKKDFCTKIETGTNTPTIFLGTRFYRL